MSLEDELLGTSCFVSLTNKLDKVFEIADAGQLFENNIVKENINDDSKADIVQLKRSLLMKVVQKFKADSTEIEKYSLFDSSKPYTRNLIAANNNYTLLLLCWNPNIQSKIHDHPCESCILMPLSGTLKEERFSYDGESIIDTKPFAIKFYLKGQISYMNNSLGLHRITNPRKYINAISLHLYYPPFGSCAAWSPTTSSSTQLYVKEEVKMGTYSIRGLRTPTLEGRLGQYGRVMVELKSKVSLAD